MNRHWHTFGRFAFAAAGAAALASLLGVAGASSPAPEVSISNVPLVLVQPTDPQVLVIVPNSQSMDGDLGGAIMTGSGQTGIASLTNSASPQYYSVPQGFTPPESPAVNGQALYTYVSSGVRYDNSASRLNVAKEAIKGVLRQYAASFDFGLMTYKTSGAALYTTWLYYMSGDGGFTFGNATTQTAPAGTQWQPNPCYLNTNSYCTQIGNVDTGATTQPDVAAAITSDDASINDVLYAGGLSPVCLDYGSHNPTTPYPPYRSLYNYNTGNILVSYQYHTGSCAYATGPTNAGYVPYSPQVLYAERGFGYYISSQSASSGDVVVGVASAGTGGNPPTQSQLTAYLLKFAPYLQAETSQSSSQEIKALAVQSPIAGLISCANKYFGGTGSGTCATGGSPPPSNNGCTPNKYVVLVTDGLPTEDLNGYSWPPLGTASAEGYGVHATFNLAGGGTIADTNPGFEAAVAGGETTTLASTNDQALTDAITKLTALKNSGVLTYVVGMGAGVDVSKNPAAAATMKAMAIAGGTTDYFHGVSPQDVVNDMNIIFALIQAQNQSTTTVAVNSTSYQTGEAVFQARFDSSAYHWSGNMVAFPVLANGTVDVNPSDEIWDARSWMATNFGGSGWDTNRQAVTVNSATGSGVPFRWSDVSAAQQTELEAHWSDLTASQQSAFGSQAAYGQAVLDYLRGDQSETLSNGGPFRDRTYLLGDIVNSAPLYVGAPNGVFPGADYATFVSNYANRTPMLYVGSNDGALHAFDANNGHEVFEFFPQGPFANLANLSEPSYDGDHEFFVDGSPNAGDVLMSDGKWHTLLVGGLGDGGAGIYAMDITDPSQWTSESSVASDVLWDITDQTSGFADLGLSYSQPQIAQVDINGSNTFVVIFGSGYNNSTQTPDLFVVNAQTGALIREIDLCQQDTSACDSTLSNGLSTPLVLSSTGSSLADRVYAGDLQGNLWRVDLSDPDPANWTATVLFKAQQSGTPQPITTQPVASFAPGQAGGGGGVLVFFGTGQYLGQPDVTNTETQSFYAVLDRGQTANLPMGDSNLNQVTLTDTTTSGGTVVRTASSSQIDWSTQWGWYMNLPDTGERVVTDPRLYAGRIIFTTFVPSTAACSAGGSSWLMVVNYATGGALPSPEIDVNGDNQLNSGDTVNGTVPVGMSLGAGYAAAPRIVRYRQGPFNDLKLITISGSPVKSVKDHGVGPGQLSWTEIR